MDSDVKFGYFYLILGLIFLFILVYLKIRDAIRGVRSVNGIVIGENPEICIPYSLQAGRDA